MKSNLYLSISAAVLHFLKGMCVLALGLMLYDGIRHTIDPEFYFVRWEWYGLSGDMDFVEKGEYPAQSTFSYYFNWVQIAIQLLMMFMIWNTLLRVLRSVSSFKTFMVDNSRHFQRIAHFLVILFFLNMFHFFDRAADDELTMKWDADLSILFFALGAYVLALIFKEGKRLADDQNLIV